MVSNIFYFPFHISDAILPIDELIFFRGVGQPPTRSVSKEPSRAMPSLQSALRIQEKPAAMAVKLLAALGLWVWLPVSESWQIWLASWDMAGIVTLDHGNFANLELSWKRHVYRWSSIIFLAAINLHVLAIFPIKNTICIVDFAIKSRMYRCSHIFPLELRT